MANGSYETDGGVGLSKLFNDKAPNLIPQAVMDAINGKGSIVDNLFALNVKGYSVNVRKYYKYGLNKYLGGMPRGQTNKTNITPAALIDATEIEAKKIFVLEATRQEAIAAQLKTELGALHPDYILAQEKADNTLLLSTTLTIKAAVTTEEHPGQYIKGITYTLENIGLILTPSNGVLEGESFLFNTPSYYPITLMEDIYAPDFLYGFNHNKDGSVQVRYIDNSGQATLSPQINSGHYQLKYPNPDPDHSPVNAYITVKYLTVNYKINEIDGPGTFVWVYRIDSDIYPDIYKSSSENVNFSDILPIATIRRDKENLDPDLNEDGTPIDDLGYSANKMLEKILVDSRELTEVLQELPDPGDMDDAHVGFFANFTSDIPQMIRYNMKFFEALREYNGVFDEGDYNDETLPDQDARYKEEWPDIPELANPGFIFSGTGPDTGQVNLLGHSYRVNLEVDLNTVHPGYIIFFNSGLTTVNTHFIYKEIVTGSIGRKGTTSIFIEDLTKNWVKPPLTNGPNDGQNGIGVGYIEYKEQLNSTQYKLIRVHKPTVKFTNWWFGDTWADSGTDTFSFQYSLRDNSGGRVEDPKEMLVFPLLYNIVRKYSGISETKIYYDSLSMLMFTVVVTFIPAWIMAITILFILIFAFLGTVLGPVSGVVSTLTSIILSVLSVVVTIIGRIVASVVANAKGEQEGAIAGAGIGIAFAILSLGSNISLLLENIVKLVIEILGLILNIVKITFQAVSLDITEKTLKLIEDGDEEAERLKELEELYDTSTDYDPFFVGDIWDPNETASEYYAKRLDIDANRFVIDAVYNFFDIALYLPEEEYALQSTLEMEDNPPEEFIL